MKAGSVKKKWGFGKKLLVGTFAVTASCVAAYKLLSYKAKSGVPPFDERLSYEGFSYLHLKDVPFFADKLHKLQFAAAVKEMREFKDLNDAGDEEDPKRKQSSLEEIKNLRVTEEKLVDALRIDGLRSVTLGSVMSDRMDAVIFCIRSDDGQRTLQQLEKIFAKDEGFASFQPEIRGQHLLLTNVTLTMPATGNKGDSQTQGVSEETRLALEQLQKDRMEHHKAQLLALEERDSETPFLARVALGYRGRELYAFTFSKEDSDLLMKFNNCLEMADYQVDISKRHMQSSDFVLSFPTEPFLNIGVAFGFPLLKYWLKPTGLGKHASVFVRYEDGWMKRAFNGTSELGELPFVLSFNCSSVLLMRFYAFFYRKIFFHSEKREHKGISYFHLMGKDNAPICDYTIQKGNFLISTSEAQLLRHLDESVESESAVVVQDGIKYNPLFYMPKKTMKDLLEASDHPGFNHCVKVMEQHLDKVDLSLPESIEGNGYVTKDHYFGSVFRFKGLFKK